MESSFTRHFPRWIEAARHGLIHKEGGLSPSLKIQANFQKAMTSGRGTKWAEVVDVR
jgi:hypothetical protein